MDVPKVAIKKPVCAIELKINKRFTLFCFKAEKVPMTVVINPKNKNRNWRSIIQTEVILNQINKKLKRETFGIIEKNIVLDKGTPSYTSAAQAWNGKQASFTRTEK